MIVVAENLNAFSAFLSGVFFLGLAAAATSKVFSGGDRVLLLFGLCLDLPLLSPGLDLVPLLLLLLPPAGDAATATADSSIFGGDGGPGVSSNYSQERLVFGQVGEERRSSLGLFLDSLGLFRRLLLLLLLAFSRHGGAAFAAFLTAFLGGGCGGCGGIDFYAAGDGGGDVVLVSRPGLLFTCGSSGGASSSRGGGDERRWR